MTTTLASPDDTTVSDRAPRARASPRPGSVAGIGGLVFVGTVLVQNALRAQVPGERCAGRRGDALLRGSPRRHGRSRSAVRRRLRRHRDLPRGCGRPRRAGSPPRPGHRGRGRRRGDLRHLLGHGRAGHRDRRIRPPRRPGLLRRRRAVGPAQLGVRCVARRGRHHARLPRHACAACGLLSAASGRARASSVERCCSLVPQRPPRSSMAARRCSSACSDSWCGWCSSPRPR